MTATTMSVTGSPTAPALDRLADVLLLAFVAALQLSIALASILLARFSSAGSPCSCATARGRRHRPSSSRSRSTLR